MRSLVDNFHENLALAVGFLISEMLSHLKVKPFQPNCITLILTMIDISVKTKTSDIINKIDYHQIEGLKYQKL